jgi:hypothetical protein
MRAHTEAGEHGRHDGDLREVIYVNTDERIRWRSRIVRQNHIGIDKDVVPKFGLLTEVNVTV